MPIGGKRMKALAYSFLGAFVLPRYLILGGGGASLQPPLNYFIFNDNLFYR